MSERVGQAEVVESIADVDVPHVQLLALGDARLAERRARGQRDGARLLESAVRPLAVRRQLLPARFIFPKSQKKR